MMQLIWSVCLLLEYGHIIVGNSLIYFWKLGKIWLLVFSFNNNTYSKFNGMKIVFYPVDIFLNVYHSIDQQYLSSRNNELRIAARVSISNCRDPPLPVSLSQTLSCKHRLYKGGLMSNSSQVKAFLPPGHQPYYPALASMSILKPSVNHIRFLDPSVL